MALSDTIYVNEQSAPVIRKQLLDFRNDSIVSNGGPTANQNAVDITGYTFQLIIKRIPVGIRASDGYPQVYDPDSQQLKYTGTIDTAALGTFYFNLDLAATCCYGTYVAEIRWWAAGVSTSGRPTDRVTTTLEVERAINSTYP